MTALWWRRHLLTCLALLGAAAAQGICPVTATQTCGYSGLSIDNTCQYYNSSTQCFPSSCLNSSHWLSPSYCSGTGQCGYPTQMLACPNNFACNLITASCNTACGSDTDCAGGNSCTNGACINSAVVAAPTNWAQSMFGVDPFVVYAVGSAVLVVIIVVVSITIFKSCGKSKKKTKPTSAVNLPATASKYSTRTKSVAGRKRGDSVRLDASWYHGDIHAAEEGEAGPKNEDTMSRKGSRRSQRRRRSRSSGSRSDHGDSQMSLNASQTSLNMSRGRRGSSGLPRRGSVSSSPATPSQPMLPIEEPNAGPPSPSVAAPKLARRGSSQSSMAWSESGRHLSRKDSVRLGAKAARNNSAGVLPVRAPTVRSSSMTNASAAAKVGLTTPPSPGSGQGLELTVHDVDLEHDFQVASGVGNGPPANLKAALAILEDSDEHNDTVSVRSGFSLLSETSPQKKHP